jgi:hypothetical protein
MGTLSKLEKAKIAVEYILVKKKDRVREIAAKMDMTEAQRIFIGEETDFIRNVETLVGAVKMKANEYLGKLPPQAVDLEESVVGAVLIEKEAIKKVIPFLLPKHLYSEPNQIIYQACINLHERNEPVDMRLVVMELRRLGKIEAVGGVSYIAELTSKLSSAANIEFHARIVLEMAIKREIIVMSGKLLRDGYEDSKDCFVLLEEAEEHLTGVKSWIK